MAQYTPDSTLLEVLDEGNEGDNMENLEGTLQGGEDDHGGAGNGQGSGCGRPPHHVRGHGGMGGPGSAHGCGSIREYDPDPPRSPNVLNQLVAALHDASLQANP